MRGLVFAQSVNMVGRKDATGAFLPGAQQFTRKYNLGKPIQLDDTGDKNTVFSSLEKAHDLDVVVYFGHGTRASLPSADIYWKDLRTLAPLISNAAAPGCQVLLFACSTGEVGCFANQLSKLMNYEYTVWGHTCVGHSFTNPYLTRFPNEGSPFLIEPHGPLWAKWYRLIKGKSDIWTRFAFMSQDELEAEIASGGTVH